MAIFVIAFLFSHRILNGKLQFALNLPKKIVNENIIILLIQLILNSYQFEPHLEFLRLLEQIKRIKNADKR